MKIERTLYPLETWLSSRSSCAFCAKRPHKTVEREADGEITHQFDVCIDCLVCLAVAAYDLKLVPVP